MKMLRAMLLIGALLVWQVPAHAGNAFLLRPLRYHVTRGGYPMPERRLPLGAIVKVLAIHGAKADVVTSSGDTVSVSLAYLHEVPDAPASTPTPPIQQPAIATPTPPIQQPAVATPTPSNPSPSPNRAGGGGDKAAGTGPARPGETGERSVSVRCSHITKKGEQCSRMTTSPNGLCWQHGGN